MKIIDKRRDYYDNILVSDSPIWVRKDIDSTELHESKSVLTEEQFRYIKELFGTAPNFPHFIAVGTRPRYGSVNVQHHFVAFCGKFYLMYSCEDASLKVNKIFASTPQELFAKQVATKNWEGLKFHIETTKKYGGWGDNAAFNDPSHLKFVNVLQHGIADAICIKNNTPVVLFTSAPRKRERMVKINPILKEIEFQKIIDPWQTYQMIDMYLGNNLVKNELKDFKLSEELMRDSKGHDNWSFKQMGPKPRKSRRSK